MNQPKKIYLRDYQAPSFSISQAHLSFQIFSDYTLVKSELKFHKELDHPDLILNGEDLELISVKVNDQVWSYDKTEKHLTILNTPQAFTLKIENKIFPQNNTNLEGLYQSGPFLTTQCEPESFRKITYFLDRPDVMTSFTVSIEADKKTYPILLSNGDCIERTDLHEGRHRCVWKDPHKKPSYLFALVAGDLGVLKDQFKTKSGKTIQLEIYSAHGTQDRCHHAMESLKRSMKWDEERFGLEYDLSSYMIVAMDDFNAGAMENKGLNIFNSRLVFADPKTATDDDYNSIDSVIAHEYFHNWTGNRVTLRDWFHLSLKEGLTVFRDQEYSMDQSSRALVRIDNVNDLRNYQFAEDEGPNAHPIRPESCYAVDNFFTSTIYEKGAEVIRMMQTMVGRPGFRKGMDLYFERFDGKAVIIEDFAKAISDANNQDWGQFQLWYSQAGTPVVTIRSKYIQSEKKFIVQLEQNCPLTLKEKNEGLLPEQKKPFHIPLVVGLIDQDGKEIAINSQDVFQNSEQQYLIHFKNRTQTVTFDHVERLPYLSINRSFSAPIKIEYQQDFSDLIHLSKYDSDLFNRWEAWQKIYLKEFQNLVSNNNHESTTAINRDVLNAFSRLLESTNVEPYMKAVMMRLPELDSVVQSLDVLDSNSILKALNLIKSTLAQQNEKSLLSIYQKLHSENSSGQTYEEVGKRKLKNSSLGLLSYIEAYESLAIKQLSESQIMTDSQAALGILVESQNENRQTAIELFYQKYQSEALVLNKWFAVQAASYHPDTFITVQKLLSHPAFNIKNPNRVYSLLREFGNNLISFHQGSGETYRFMADQIIVLDKINPQVAARISGCFDVWKKLPGPLKQSAHQELERLQRHGLSQNTHEIISNCLL